MSRTARILIWIGVALLGALAVATIALHRGEQINAMWLVVAAVCSYALGYRFYSKFIAAKVLALDAMLATPAERLENGRDFVRTNKWVVFGHHFAAIAGPGPLVGPVLAAQFGYLPGTLWSALSSAAACKISSSFFSRYAAMGSLSPKWRKTRSAGSADLLPMSP
jgi:carbon starvation protein